LSLLLCPALARPNPSPWLPLLWFSPSPSRARPCPKFSSFDCATNLVKQIIFPVKMLYIKVVDNLLILLMLKFHYHRPNNLK
ncbi:hypothetical protein ACJX0J_034371, partial [Zea mays]